MAGPRLRIVRTATLMLAACVLLVTSVAGCSKDGDSTTANSSEAAKPEQPELNGVYEFTYDWKGFVFGGRPMPEQKPLKRPKTYAIRSVCRDTGCVALATRFTDGKLDGTSEALDFVDGRWTRMSKMVDKTCDNGKPATPFWTFSLEPHPDGTLSGKETDVYLGGCPEVHEIPLALKRIGDLPPGVADPAALSRLSSSAPQAFHGKYQFSGTRRDTGQPIPTSPPVDFHTLCVRNTEYCVAIESVTTPQGSSARGFGFADGHWTNTGEYDPPCTTVLASDPTASPEPGASQHESVIATYAVPVPLQDPIAELVGTITDTVSNGCRDGSTAAVENDAKYTRIGD